MKYGSEAYSKLIIIKTYNIHWFNPSGLYVTYQTFSHSIMVASIEVYITHILFLLLPIFNVFVIFITNIPLSSTVIQRELVLRILIFQFFNLLHFEIVQSFRFWLRFCQVLGGVDDRWHVGVYSLKVGPFIKGVVG